MPTTTTLTPEEVFADEPAIVTGVDTPRDGDAIDLWVTDRETGVVIAMLGAGYCNNPVRQVELNVPDRFTFAANCMDPDTVLIEPLVTEVQVFRGGHLEFVGPVMHVDQSDPTWDVFTAFDPRIYLTHRFWGSSPWAREWFRNPRFDSGSAYWEPVSCTVDTVLFQTGTQSLVVGGSIEQGITPTMSSNPWGAVIQAWLWVADDATWTGRGLEVRTYSAGPGGEPEVQVAPIPSDVPREQWTAITIQLPAAVRISNTVQTLLEVDGTGINCDRMSFRINQADGANIEEPAPEAVDARELITRSVDGLNIGFRRVGSSGAAVGIDVDRFVDELLRVATDAQICDFGIEYTRTTRTIVQYVPRMGVDVDPGVLSFTSANVDVESLTFDYTKARSEVVCLGDDGFRGVAFDYSAWGGLRLTDQIQAESGTPVADLEPQARRELRTDQGDVRTLEIAPTQAVPLGTLGLGDRVEMVWDRGTRQINGMQRILGWSEDWKAKRYASVVLAVEPEA